jgi:hypothetical protein
MWGSNIMKLRMDMKAGIVCDNYNENEVRNSKVRVRAGASVQRTEESSVEISARRSAVKQLCELAGLLASVISTEMAGQIFFGKTPEPEKTGLFDEYDNAPVSLSSRTVVM